MAFEPGELKRKTHFTRLNRLRLSFADPPAVLFDLEFASLVMKGKLAGKRIPSRKEMNMMNRIGTRTGLGSALAFALAAYTTVGPVSAARMASASCDTVCYDFGSLTLMNQYHIGDTFVAQDATIHLESYLWNGNLISLTAGTAYANNSNIAKGVRPELRTYFITNRVVPDVPLSSVTFRFGQIVAPNGPVPHSNIGVNGDLREVAAIRSVTSPRSPTSDLYHEVIVRPGRGFRRARGSAGPGEGARSPDRWRERGG